MSKLASMESKRMAKAWLEGTKGIANKINGFVIVRTC